MNYWKSVKKAQALIEASKTIEAKNLIAKLPDSFSHKHYLLATLLAANGDCALAFESLRQAIAQAADIGLKDFYVRELLNLKHEKAFDIAYLEEILGRKYIFDEKTFDHGLWKNPSKSPKDLIISSEILKYVVNSQKNNAMTLSLEGTAWEIVSNRDEGFLSDDAEIYFQLDDLIGAVGLGIPTLSMRLEYMSFLTQRSESRYSRFCSDLPYECGLATNLGSRLDVQIIDFATKISGTKSTGLDVLEVGGGYGRLCEALISNSENIIRNYYLIDAVPSSIAAAYEYLSVNLPDSEITIVGGNLNRPGNENDLSKTRIFIVPSWEVTNFVFPTIDVAINIESFQEMSGPWVSFYMDLFQKSLDDNGFLYLSNSRCYKNKSMPAIGKDWNVQLLLETPRSWTPDHPTIVLTKCDNHKDYSSLRNGYAEPWKIVP